MVRQVLSLLDVDLGDASPGPAAGLVEPRGSRRFGSLELHKQRPVSGASEGQSPGRESIEHNVIIYDSVGKTKISGPDTNLCFGTSALTALSFVQFGSA